MDTDDPRLNRIPSDVRRIHLTAACGTAMGALAAVLKDLGFQVTGSDQNVYPPMSDFLASQNIPLAAGFSAENLRDRPDLVVIGNAVRRDNPEAAAVREMKLCYCSMPQAVNHFMAAGKKIVLITGTHGKTTTAALAAWLLQTAGQDPSFLIGGILNNFKQSYRLGGGAVIVLEGDEYDTAFFDKGPKFLHYPPARTVVTGIEFDHADIYADLDAVRGAFLRLITGLRSDSLLAACDQSSTLAALAPRCKGRWTTYGQDPESDWRLGAVRTAPPWSIFDVHTAGSLFGTFRSPLMGRHNLLNALAVIAVLDSLGISRPDIGRGLETFAGVRRRQEIRGVRRGITVMDDFAHHPTAVRETIAAVRPFFPEGRLVAVFEPRTNTSMRKVFQEDYAAAFDGADRICVRHPPLLHKIPSDQRFSSKKLAADLKRRGKDARFFADTDTLIDFLTATSRPGDLLLVMSNGGFDNIHERLLNLL